MFDKILVIFCEIGKYIKYSKQDIPEIYLDYILRVFKYKIDFLYKVIHNYRTIEL